MHKQPILAYIHKLKRPVFTTGELSQLSGKSSSVITQSLNYLAKNDLVMKVCRGVWADAAKEGLSLYAAISCLFPKSRACVSFLSALHLYGIIEQIPQVITLASISHTRKIRTSLGVISVHQLTPGFFRGFDWYQGNGSFLIAEPEKALVDSLYLSACKKKQFAHFPELHFPKTFNFRKAKMWVRLIRNPKVRLNVKKKLNHLTKSQKYVIL